MNVNRRVKSYSGDLMDKGRENEDIILTWLRNYGRSIIDFREFRLAQRIDVDFGIETIDGNIVLAEIKSDKWISETGNLFFENHRINHFKNGGWFYLGWGWRSPAQKLIVRNPHSDEIFIFDFPLLRSEVGRSVARLGKHIKIGIVETDDQKTTFGLLLNMSDLRHLYKKYTVNATRDYRKRG